MRERNSPPALHALAFPADFGEKSGMTRLWQQVSQKLRQPGSGLFLRRGKTSLFRNYLNINQLCVIYGLELGAFRTDDAPRYFTIFVVGLVFPTMLLPALFEHPSEWLHAATWLSFTLAMILLTAPRARAAAIGVTRAKKPRG